MSGVYLWFIFLTQILTIKKIMKKFILGLVIMTALVACSSQETKTSDCDSTCVDSTKCDSAVVVPQDSVKVDTAVVGKK